MTTIPDAAIEAAAEAMREHYPCCSPGECGGCGYIGPTWEEHVARAAIKAAMPAIREANVQEVVGWLREFLPKWDYPDYVVAAICLEIKARLEGAE